MVRKKNARYFHLFDTNKKDNKLLEIMSGNL